MKILITGAGGFLGQYLAKELNAHDVHALTRQQLDFADAGAVHRHFSTESYDAVIHCGAAGRNTPLVEDSSIVSNNLACVMNLMTYRHKFKQLINIGTGAEFDVSLPIDNVHESDIFKRNPSQSYGLSKNTIARYLSQQSNCITLRLFGCFDKSEEERRLLKKCYAAVSTGNKFNIQDKLFDMISAADFVTIIRAVLSKEITHKDINCVYHSKYQLSEILKMFCLVQGLDPTLINVTGQGLSYTGNSDILDEYQLPLLGLKQSLSLY